MNLKLRKYTEADAVEVLSWFDSDVMFYQWSADKFNKYPITTSEFNDFYKKMRKQEGIFTPFVVVGDGNELISHFFLWKVNKQEDFVRFGFFVISDKFRGKGFARQIMELAKNYAKEIFKVPKLTLGVFENNEHARACYQKLGFELIDLNKRRFFIKDELWKGYEMYINLEEQDAKE